MAKTLAHLEIKVDDTDAPGTPDQVSYAYRVGDTDDEELAKYKYGIYEDADLSKTVTALYTEIEDWVKTEEGIS